MIRPLPNLVGHDEPLGFDTETTGLDPFKGGDRPVGLSLCAQQLETWYLPWGHLAGFNYAPEQVRLWCADNLRGKTLIGANLKFDVHMMREWGVDLEALGCKLRDVQHHAALIDERRKSYSLESLSQDYLGRGKIALPSRQKIHEVDSAIIALYAERDAELVVELDRKFRPIIEKEDLERVRALEDALTYVTCEMERNGAPLDMEKLASWQRLCRQKYQADIFKIQELVGFKVEPSKPRDLARMYRKLGLEYQETETGVPSFTTASLKQSSQHEAVRLANEARQLFSLDTKYLTKYLEAVDSHGVLRYHLHQLRASHDERGSGAFGTVGGRYSSSDINIQQVFSEDNQVERLGDMFIIRELFVETEPGLKFFSADASQIEFRIFAHYCGDERLVAAYRDDPTTDFHDMVAYTICGIPRRPAKSINFGRAYGMGRDKMARQMGMSRAECDPMFDAWDRNFPKAVALLKKAEKLAKDRGYVKTFLGRRRRYGKADSERHYTAWNHVGQGTAADIMKLVLLDAYQHRRDLGLKMRFTVHDELCGGVPLENRDMLREFLDVQRIPLKVPITWKVKVGNNWRMK